MRKFAIIIFLLLLSYSGFCQIQTINVGASAHSGSADTPRNAFIKTNSNFTYLDDGKLSEIISFNEQTGDYTLVSSDKDNKVVLVNSASDLTVTIPPDVFSVGAQISIARINTGAVAIAEGVGVTIISADDALSLRTTGSMATAIQIASNEWLLIGDLQ